MMSDSTKSFEDFLDESGLKQHYRGDSSLNTSLFHDLEIYGDIAESYIELLHDKYGVSVSDFTFNEYFPEEFVGSTSLERVKFWFLPFLRPKIHEGNEYKYFTFQKIKDSIISGYLI